MNKFKTLTVGAVLVAASFSALSAPLATRHAKLLSVKQVVRFDGSVGTNASIVQPTAQSNATGIVVVTNQFGASPLASADIATFDGVSVERYNYTAFWQAMERLQICENAIAAQDEVVTSNPTTGIFAKYLSQVDPPSAKKSANMALAHYPTSAGSTYASIPACNTGSIDTYLLGAAKTRANVSNYAVDSPEAVDYVTSKHWLQDEDKALNLKRAVAQYLFDKNLEFAWVDVEFDYEHTSANPVNRRVSMSFQINRGDDYVNPIVANRTKGGYVGSKIVLAPGASPGDVTASTRNNTINIKYSAYSQYPDIGPGTGSNVNMLQLSAETTGAGLNRDGVLSWQVTPDPTNPSTISSRICSGIPTTDGFACIPTAGKAFLSSGAYDPTFKRVSPDEIAGSPYTIENLSALQDESGIKCLVTGEGKSNCRIDKHNASTLMQYGAAYRGTLEYAGRWEIELAAGTKPEIEEISRAAIFDVCYGVQFENNLDITHWVRRPFWKAELSWQDSGAEYTILERKYIVENVKLQRPSHYATYPLPANGYNLVGDGTQDNLRSTATVATASTEANHYSAVKAGSYDPSGLGLPDNEGAIIMNPFVTTLTSGGTLANVIPRNWSLYRAVPGVAANQTYAAHMKGTPPYKQAAYGASNALPKSWLARGNTALTRDADFQCVDQNEFILGTYTVKQENYVPFLGSYGGFPLDPYVPTGSTYFPGSVQAHKKGTRTTGSMAGAPGTAMVAPPDPCEISYVLWSNVTWHIVSAGPLPDPMFVPPIACVPPSPSVPGWTPPPPAVCSAPLNYYTKTVIIDDAEPIELVDVLDTCRETCELGDSVKLCVRPWQRFP